MDRLTLVEKISCVWVSLRLQSLTPTAGSINEAIELSKQFSDEKSSKFIMGF
ncbi:hypothetical protein HGP05_01910 [Streptococcus sanguinis]|uniref:NusB/RsmB/TIM44 domain-containing protein n=1 Tax=Streptococcus sanguinis TaxID=1305 RepID=A0A7Y0VC04_STRSA|nr:hypothetical protein [Streptococcus sanguinis]